MIQFSNIQLEEGDIATSYEPYKETNATIYLNSPLLKGDRIEVVDGKLCHYHKMESIVLNGSEEWWLNVDNTPFVGLAASNINCIKNNDNKIYCDTLKPSGNITTNAGNSGLGIYLVGTYNTPNIRIRLTLNDTKEGVKQWLQVNPTTVVYELEEPYYEDITPIQSSFVISTVSEGDMEIFTDLPIKSNITYLTNIASAVLMEQQLDELDNGTESLTNIVEDEINE
jgi:hypothetical protein